MKNYFQILAFLLCSVHFAFGQEQQVYTMSKVHALPIMSGCEKKDPTDRKSMVTCISSNLNADLYKSMKGFDEIMKQSGIEKAEAIIQFLVSKEGVIIDISALQGSNPILADAAVLAFEKLAMDYPPIQPAKLKDGTPVNVIFQLPFEYVVPKTKEVIKNDNPNAKEIVIFSLLPESNAYRYEVRLFKNKEIKVYEVNSTSEVFLGKYITLNELEQSEPYKTLLESARKQAKTLISEGIVDGEFYQVYVHNLFQNSKNKSVYVEVLKEVEGKFISVEKFEKESDFESSKYAPLIYRD